MQTIHSNADALLIAIPMVGLLFAVFFRLDELVVKPKASSQHRRPISGLDKDGRQICLDPDGTPQRLVARKR